MWDLFALLCLTTNLVIILFIIKTIKEKDEEVKKGKRKITFNSLAVTLVFLILVGVTGCRSDSSVPNKTIEEVKNDVEQVESEGEEIEEIEETTPKLEEQSEDEETEEEFLDVETVGSDSDTKSNKEFISEYETDIIVAASLSLDSFLDKKSYKMSLASQNWTIVKFDETETTVLGMTDITYNGQKGKYIYVGTLNIDASGKVESATPHYLEVNGQVLGDDGYCDDVFNIIKSLGS